MSSNLNWTSGSGPSSRLPLPSLSPLPSLQPFPSLPAFGHVPASSLPSLPPLSAGSSSSGSSSPMDSLGAHQAFVARHATERHDEGTLLALKQMRELGVRTEIAGIETAPLPQELEAARPRMTFAEGDNISHIVHGESKVSVEDVLEVLADAVLAIVLFQIEADENESHLISTKFEGLVQACTFFSQLARQKAELWEESEEAQNKEVMLAKSDQMRDVVFEMSKQLKKLSDNQFDQEAKEELMFKCREVMETCVGLLELSDRYDIRKILRLCARSKGEASRMNAPPPLAQFEQCVSGLIQQSTMLSRYVDQRVGYLSDPVMEARLTNGNVEVRQLPEQLIHAALACIQQPNNSQLLVQKEAVFTKLIKAIDDVEEATVESQKRMFAGILMDLEPIKRDNVVITEPDDPNSAESVLGHFEGLLGQAADAFSEGAASRAGALLRHAGTWLSHLNGMARLKMEAMAEGPQKDLMAEALARLQKSLGDMVEVGKKLKLDPKNALLLSELDRIFNHSVALDFMAAWNAPGFSDLFGKDVLAALAHLNHLKEAFVAGDHPGAILAAKSAAACLQQQLVEGQRVAAGLPQGSVQQVNLLDACGRVNGMLQDLLRAVKDALEDPNNAAKRGALFAAIEKAKLLAGELAMLTHPPKEPGLFDDAALARSTQQVHDALDALLRAAQSADPAQLAGPLRQLTEALARQSGLARNASAASKYPAQVEKIQEVFGKVQATLGNLVTLAKEQAQRPGDSTTVAQMQQCLVQGHRVADALSDASSAFFDQMLGSIARLQEALDGLRDAAAGAAGSAEDPRVLQALQQARDVVTYQTKLAADHANLRPSAREAVSAAATGHLRALQSLLADLTQVLSDPNRVAGVHKPAMRETSLRLLEAIAGASDDTIVDRLLCQSHRIDALGGDLEKHVANPLDPTDVRAAARQTRQAVSDGAELLELASRSRRARGDQRSRLVQLAGLLGDKIRDLLPSVDAGLRGDGSGLRLCLSSVRSLAAEGADLLIDPAELPRMMELEALKAGRAANPLFETPQLSARQRDDIVGVLQHTDNLRHLALSVAKHSVTDPKERREMVALAGGFAPIHSHIRDHADALLSAQAGSPEASAAQSALRSDVREAKALAEKLVAKTYAGDVAKRLTDNGAALDQDTALLQEHLARGEQPEAAAVLPVATARVERQKELCRHAAQHCLNPAVREPLGAALDRLTGLSAPLAPVCQGAIRDIRNPAAVQPSQQLLGGLRTISQQATELALEALKPAPPAAQTAGIVEITSLATAAQHMQAATDNLVFDDTPKGRLNRAAWSIAQGMRELADAAAIDDKRNMIAAARKIASFTATLVQDATSVGTVCRDVRVTNQLVSMARAGKNWSVQLKILCAVKASSSGKDDTAESQLLTCATGLAQSVVQCVKEADVAELKR